MPSYYDSTKAKPGLAEIKYQAGGKVLEPYPTHMRWVGNVDPETGESLPGGKMIRVVKPKKQPKNPPWSERIRNSAWLTRRPRMSRENVAKAVKEAEEKMVEYDEQIKNKVKKQEPKKKMRHGGQLKVRGMGAATSGGNFSRNG
jgi:hypothetical protein